MRLVALDQGTTSTRAIVFEWGEEGVRPLAQARRTHVQHRPRPGWVEHDPEEIARHAEEVLREAVSAAGGGGEIAALGITNQRETFLFWEAQSGKPVTPAVVWQDTRATEVVARLEESGDGENVRRRTGLPPSTYFSAPKAAFLLREDPHLAGRARRGEVKFGTIDSWLVFRLTGGRRHVTEPTNASRTQLFDLARGDWSDELCGLFGVPRACLPEVVPTADPEAFGTVREELGLGAVRIGAAVGDQQAALVGHGGIRRGGAKCTYGTGAFFLQNIGDRPILSHRGLLTTVAHHLPGAEPHFAWEGSIAYAGALVDWLVQDLGLAEDVSAFQRLAESVEDAGGAVIVPAFSGLFAPHWRKDARGVIAGLTRYVRAAHLCRAALEAVAHQTADVLEAAVEQAGERPERLAVDGGMARSDLFLAILSDVLDVSVERPEILEVTALGAALCASLAAGVLIERLEEGRRVERRFEPSSAEEDRRRARNRWRRALERALGWENEEVPEA